MSAARFARIRNGLPYFAEVALSVRAADAFRFESRCAGAGWIRQGEAEDVTAHGYDAWKRGAAAGASLACVAAGRPDTVVAIERITGTTTDTNPTIVAAATALAVWQALGFSPPPALRSRIETETFDSWSHPDDVPDWRIASE